jgi:hypothetical protein
MKANLLKSCLLIQNNEAFSIESRCKKVAWELNFLFRTIKEKVVIRLTKTVARYLGSFFTVIMEIRPTDTLPKLDLEIIIAVWTNYLNKTVFCCLSIQ